jgi:uncharacterized Zn finger protein
MQTTKAGDRIVHKCEQCGMVVTIVLPTENSPGR